MEDSLYGLSSFFIQRKRKATMKGHFETPGLSKTVRTGA